MNQISLKKLMSIQSPSRKLSIPSTPSSLAREFIRQYYNIFNQSPVHLHLLYSKDSSLMHGDDILVKGQSEIHKKVMELNFIDCFAEIKNMEVYSICNSDMMLGQVCGELLNHRSCTRRFMQSLVLEPKCPNKYHILNDIFRYLVKPITSNIKHLVNLGLVFQDDSMWLCEHNDEQGNTDEMESIKEEDPEDMESSSVTYAMIVKGNKTSPIHAEQSICHLTPERFNEKEANSSQFRGNSRDNYFMDLFDKESLYLSRSEGSYFDSKSKSIHF